MNYNIKINEFVGPLDLLLHLIKKSSMDIYDISISEITDQYLDYLHQMEKLDIEIASEYLVMASELMYIKSKALLPKKEEGDDPEEEELTEEGLKNRLEEYKKYKELTKSFKELEESRHEIYTKAPSNIEIITNKKNISDQDVSIDDLMKAFKKFLERKDKEKPLNTKITSKEYSVKKRKNDIKKYLLSKPKVEFTELFDIYNKSYIVVTFMSILELSKEEVVEITQKKNFDNIYIELKENKK